MNELADAFDRLLADACTPAVVRAAERGQAPDGLWRTLEGSGFLDALVPAAHGGAGLRLADAFDLFVAEGRHAVPLPVGPTMLTRALLAGAGLPLPDGPVAMADTVRRRPDGGLDCPQVPYGRVARWIAVAWQGGVRLLPADDAHRQASGVHGSLRADLHWAAPPAEAITVDGPLAWREAGAALAAARLAGAAERVLALSVTHANDRVQFGRSIGKFQAIQHQLAVMAEHVLAAHMAAEIGCAGAGLLPDPLQAALAKARTSEAAALVANIAHAVHGAIGITAEFDLQLYTRRLHEGRADHGAETHWYREIGRALLGAGDMPALDFMRARLVPADPETRQ